MIHFGSRATVTGDCFLTARLRRWLTSGFGSQYNPFNYVTSVKSTNRVVHLTYITSKQYSLPSLGITLAETSLIWIGREDILNVPYDSNSSFIPLVVLSICDLQVVMFGPTSVKCWTLLNLQWFRNVLTKSCWGTIDNLITSPYKRTKTTNINSSRSQAIHILTMRRHEKIQGPFFCLTLPAPADKEILIDANNPVTEFSVD